MGSQRMLFMNIGWMERYQGPQGDKIIGGGAHVRRTGWGHEAFNFKPFRGFVYGYAQPKAESIRLERFPDGYGKKELDDVLVVWVATRPGVGPVVIGWYEHATVYRSQQPGRDASRILGGVPCPYYAKARRSDTHLLHVDLRTFHIPRGGKGEMGESNVWFAEEQVALKRRLIEFISGVKAGRVKPVPPKKRKPGSFRQPDPAVRKAVEKAAVRCAKRHYIALGYSVDSREDENVGWDLDATRGDVVLRVEVKGWSGNTGLSELTPNEYDKCNTERDNYRICIVRNALTKPEPMVFHFSVEAERWEDDSGHALDLVLISAARISVTAIEEV